MAEKKNDVKILELIDTYYPVVDGAINVANFYCKELNKLTDCAIAAPKPSKKDGYVDSDEFEVIRCASSGAPEKYRSAFPDQDRRFIKRVKKGGFNIFHAHSPFVMGRFAVKTAKKLGIPVVATLHTQYHQDFERVLKSKPLVDFMISFIVKVYQNADSVWTVSERSCKFLRDYGYNGKIEVVRNGTDYKYPDNAEELISKVNALHGLEGQKNVFLFVGRMAWYKNLKIIIDALDIVKRSGVDFKMLFVGGGFDFDEVKAYAEKLGLKDDCIFTGSISDKSLIQGYYLRSDLLLFPSTFDMAPVTGVEAAAHNLPSIMTEGSCSAELVVDGENGFLAEENAQSFADKIMEVIKTPELIKKVGINAGKTLYRSWEMVAEEVLEKYKKIIADYNRKKRLFEEIKRIGAEQRKKAIEEKKNKRKSC